MLAHLINVAGSHGKDQIVVGTCLQQEVFDGIKGREVVTFRSFAADVVCQIFDALSQDRQETFKTLPASVILKFCWRVANGI